MEVMVWGVVHNALKYKASSQYYNLIPSPHTVKAPERRYIKKPERVKERETIPAYPPAVVGAPLYRITA